MPKKKDVAKSNHVTKDKSEDIAKVKPIAKSKKKAKQQTTAKKSKRTKSSNNKHINYATLSRGLFIVCIILITIFFYIKLAVDEAERKELAQLSIETESQIDSKNEDSKKINSKSILKQDGMQHTQEKQNNIDVNKSNFPKKENKKQTTQHSQKTAKKKLSKDILPNTQKIQEQNINTKKTDLHKNSDKKNINSKNDLVALTPPIKELPELPKKGTLIFVFDDAGHNLEQLKFFLNLPFQCTIAVLPHLAKSVEAAKQIRAAGKEVILHQPMQAFDLNIDPGPGAIKPKMLPDEIRKILSENVAEIAPIAGMNNHEGSLITSDESMIKTVLEFCQEKGIYYLDSRTSSKTVVAQTAKKINFPIWERAVFLDNEKTMEHFKKQIAAGLEIASIKGSAIMIGHVFSPDLAILLKEMYPALIEEGYNFSSISKMKK